MAANPYLQEFYGSVAWSVRAIYADSVGWFDGNATNMFPLAPADRATRLVSSLGGQARVLSVAQQAIDTREFQWAAELADCVLANDPANVPATRIKETAFMELGQRQMNATARNYDLSSAQHLLHH